MQQLATLTLALAVVSPAFAAKSGPPAPSDEALPRLAASLSERIGGRKLNAPDGSQVAIGEIFDSGRIEASLRTIAKGGGWPASWLVVSDASRPYDLVIRIALAADGTIADPEALFLASRREWDDKAFEAAYQSAMGSKPPRDRQRNLVVQSFTKKTVTDYVYDLPATGKGAKGLLAMLPEGSLIREAPAIDLGDGKRHTLAIVLVHPHFVPADCTTSEGRLTGHRDSGGILLVLAGEDALEDKLDITDVVRRATGAALLPRFACGPDDEAPGAIDALVERKFEGREPVRLLDLSGPKAESRLARLPVTVGVKRDDGALKLFAR